MWGGGTTVGLWKTMNRGLDPKKIHNSTYSTCVAYPCPTKMGTWFLQSVSLKTFLHQILGRGVVGGGGGAHYINQEWKTVLPNLSYTAYIHWSPSYVTIPSPRPKWSHKHSGLLSGGNLYWNVRPSTRHWQFQTGGTAWQGGHITGGPLPYLISDTYT